MMADGRKYALPAQLDIDHILREAQHRWLRPAEICEILQNYRTFHIATESPDRPSCGSIFLFDRKVVRCFRKDGHNWRKKKDGKTVKEAHEKLKAGRIDVLQCYYAHGEDNRDFQRRSYWMLEKELSHIVFVHYRNVKGNETNFNQIRESHGTVDSQPSQEELSTPDSSAASNFQPYDHQVVSQITNSTTFTSSWTSEFEDAESAYRYQASPGFQFIHDLQSPVTQNMEVVPVPYYPVPMSNTYDGKHLSSPELGFGTVVQVERDISPEVSGLTVELHKEFPSWENVMATRIAGYPSNNFQPSDPSNESSEACVILGQRNELLGELGAIDGNVDFGRNSNGSEDWQDSDHHSVNRSKGYGEKKSDNNLNLGKTNHLWYNHITEVIDVDQLELGGSTVNTYPIKQSSSIGTYIPESGQPLLDSIMRENLKKMDSFDRWMSDELGVITEPRGGLSSDSYSSGGNENGFHDSGTSIQAPLDNYIHDFVTCASTCSEVKEFGFQNSAIQDKDIVEVGSIMPDETHLFMKFNKLLSLGPVTSEKSVQNNDAETSLLCRKISAFLKDEAEWEDMLNLTKQDEFSADNVKDKFLQKLLKEKLLAWLLQKVIEGGRGPSVLDEGGQGVLHFAAALGYDWAMSPTIAAGVSVNFRDINGWTALHWAACYGRERTVAFLISLGAAPGALSDPNLKSPSGRTPADIASSNGHKGISGYLAEASLSSHLSSLNLKETDSIETVAERIATPVGYGDVHGLSLKDSLAAFRNASQAAARIHQVYRAHSFQRKQLKEYNDIEFGMSDDDVLSILALKTNKARQHDGQINSAALHIQNKFRSWKGRKDYLLIRQHVIKIQAHVRGHQVRKSYKMIIWSVGFLDKVILRWRRKGRGLSGFKPEALIMQEGVIKEEDDFLKEGRRQTEVRLEKALARVKSMVQYPEAQDQYRRLLNVVSEIQETKAMHNDLLNIPEEDFDKDIIDLGALLEDDIFMATTF